MSMKLQVGYLDQVYGTVEVQGGQYVYAGSKPDTVQRLLESMGSGNGQDKAAFLASLPERLNGRVWATPVGSR